MRKKRAQAAVEFLTVYGWAIMAVIVVIGALSYFDLLDAKRFVSERCDLGSQIECVEVYTNDAGDFEIGLRNNYPVDIKIEDVKIEGIDILDSDLILSSGSIAYLTSNQRLGEQQKGSKDEYNILITFKRNAITAVRSYNISGGIITKVHDSNYIEIPTGYCGDGIVQLSAIPPEECDNNPDRDCSLLGGEWQGGLAKCIGCQWDMSQCIPISGDLCGNGLLDLDEDCDASAGIEVEDCYVLGQGTSGLAKCDEDTCNWIFDDCSGVVSSTCITTNDCENTQICIEGSCYDNCLGKSTSNSCDSTGCKCSVGTENYALSGICTISPPTGMPSSSIGSCDKIEAVYDSVSLNFYSDCNDLLIGKPCDINLAGGFDSWGTCDSANNCVAQDIEIPIGGDCVTGNECASKLCVAGKCVDSCMGNLGKNCSYTSQSPYTNYGICTMIYGSSAESRNSFQCDTNFASYKAGVFYSDCGVLSINNPLDGSICDANSLAGGAVPNGECSQGSCETLQSTCDTAKDCSSGQFCVDGLCSNNCDTSEIHFCSDGDISYLDQGICTQDKKSDSLPEPVIICDDKIAVDAISTDGIVYSDCTSATEGLECDSDVLYRNQGGYVGNGKCVDKVCVPV